MMQQIHHSTQTTEENTPSENKNLETEDRKIIKGEKGIIDHKCNAEEKPNENEIISNFSLENPEALNESKLDYLKNPIKVCELDAIYKLTEANLNMDSDKRIYFVDILTEVRSGAFLEKLPILRNSIDETFMNCNSELQAIDDKHEEKKKTILELIAKSSKEIKCLLFSKHINLTNLDNLKKEFDNKYNENLNKIKNYSSDKSHINEESLKEEIESLIGLSVFYKAILCLLFS